MVTINLFTGPSEAWALTRLLLRSRLLAIAKMTEEDPACKDEGWTEDFANLKADLVDRLDSIVNRLSYLNHSRESAEIGRILAMVKEKDLQDDAARMVILKEAEKLRVDAEKAVGALG